MMDFNPALWALLLEALAVSILLILVMVFISKRKSHSEMLEIDKFISKLNEQGEFKNRLLEEVLLKNSYLDDQKVIAIVHEVNASERALMQRVIQMFLQRTPSLLSEIDQLISNLSEPFCKILAEIDSGLLSSQNSTMMNPGSAESLQQINQQLVKQLDTAMQTIDEITAEYTRVFSGSQTALELENSSAKMMQIFQKVEKKIESNFTDLEET